jgi:hypothetical protein
MWMDVAASVGAAAAAASASFVCVGCYQRLVLPVLTLTLLASPICSSTSNGSEPLIGRSSATVLGLML